jgi:NAD(P)-dependent dehydrogenase (short-subunit alcohol dehydrogenase family)
MPATRACLATGLLAVLLAATTFAADTPTVLITGASRGIGLELTRQYAERGWNVIATARSPAEAAALKDIAKKHPNVTLETLDVTNHAQIDSLAAKYKGKPIDVLLNNAGISGAEEAGTFGKLKYDVYDKVHAINVVGPLKMTEAFLPSVAASQQKKVINITSTEGSITRARPGGPYFYRSSKAALNMVMHSLALDLKPKGITVGLVSPGFVKTDFTKGLDLPMMITPQESAAAVVKVIDTYDLAKTGTFIRHSGEESAW